MFTAGENITSLNNKILEMKTKRLYPIVDYIKEFANSGEDVSNNIKEYKHLSMFADTEYIALKPSSFMFQFIHIDNVVRDIVSNNKKVLIDAEFCSNHYVINGITNDLIKKYNRNEVFVYKTYQMYRRDSLETLVHDFDKFENLGVKLVRGAYWNADKYTGELFNKKYDTDNAFRAALSLALQSRSNGMLHSIICTHNSDDIAFMIENYKKNNNIIHASLYGFIPNDTSNIINCGIKTYKYLPYGPIEYAAPYLFRRVLENPFILKYYFT